MYICNLKDYKIAHVRLPPILYTRSDAFFGPWKAFLTR